MAKEQSVDLAERSFNTIDTFIRSVEAFRNLKVQYDALGGSSAFDAYYQTASPDKVPKNELVDALTSLQALIGFMDANGHTSKIYKAKSQGSTVRIS